ncbi:hypothetical protein ABK040_006119 [Willaertia magna]
MITEEFNQLVAKANVFSNEEGEYVLPYSMVNELVKLAVSKLTQNDLAPIDTIKQQIGIQRAKEEIKRATMKQNNDHNHKSEYIIKELLTKENESEVVSDIILYVLHETKTFEKTNDMLEKEIKVALESVETHENEVIKQRVDIKERIDYLLHDILTEIKETSSNCEEYIDAITSGLFEGKELDRLYQELYYRRQTETYYNELKSLALEIKEENEEGDKVYIDQINEISSILKNTNEIVEKKKIYPMFILLSNNWSDIDSCKERLIELMQLFRVIKGQKGLLRAKLTPTIIQQVRKHNKNKKQPKSNEGTKELRSSKEATLEPFSAELIPELNGFCPVSLGKERLIIPGNFDLGFIKYQRKYYVFKNKDCMGLFLETPETYLEGVKKIIKFNQELIVLLDLKQLLPGRILLQSELDRIASKVDSNIQTEVHPVESYIDTKYEFSQWKLRRNAVKAADLRDKKDNKTQTLQSHFRRDNDTQVYLKKEKTTQTPKDAGTNPMKHVRYIKGLRGKAETKMSVVELKFDQNM